MSSGLDSAQLRRLLDAVVGLGAGLDLETILARVAHAATELAGATYGALGVLNEAGTHLDDFITVGVDDEQRARIGSLPQGHGILGLIIHGEVPVRLDDLTAHPDRYGFPPGHPPMRSFLGVPIRMGERQFGDLYLTEKRGGGSFTDADEQLIVGLAAAAGVAIENARLHDQVQQLALADDRARIARDLHDTVIQRLFATGLSLQGTQAMLDTAQSTVADRIGDAIDDLDETVKQIRTAIFDLDGARRRTRVGSVRAAVLAVCEDAGRALGFSPSVAFDGAVDTLVPMKVADDLLAALAEALSNVARHAKAKRVSVGISASFDQVVLEVRDDGIGGAHNRPGGRGLHNIADRAVRRGGSCDVSDGLSGGTVVHWTVPLVLGDE